MLSSYNEPVCRHKKCTLSAQWVYHYGSAADNKNFRCLWTGCNFSLHACGNFSVTIHFAPGMKMDHWHVVMRDRKQMRVFGKKWPDIFKLFVPYCLCKLCKINMIVSLYRRTQSCCLASSLWRCVWTWLEPWTWTFNRKRLQVWACIEHMYMLIDWLVWLFLYAHRHWSVLGAAGHIMLTPANQLMVMGLKIWSLSSPGSNQRPFDHWPMSLPTALTGLSHVLVKYM
jgi:hypothetical protein